MFWVKTIKEINRELDIALNSTLQNQRLIHIQQKEINRLREELEITKTKAIKAIKTNNI